MAKVFYLHWHQAEAEERIGDLIAAGHEVHYHWGTEVPARWGDFVPDAVVISLDRLPSHGRHVAEWIWEAKKRQSIPILFAGGQAEKVESVKQRFPQAIFCQTEEVLDTLGRILQS